MRKEVYLSQNSSGRRSKHRGTKVWWKPEFGHSVVDAWIGNWLEGRKANDLTLQTKHNLISYNYSSLKH